MKEPMGEHVSLDFYFGNRSSTDALREVVLHLFARGATYSNEVLISRFEGARDAPFEGIYTNDLSQCSTNERELVSLLEDENVRVAKVGMWNAICLRDDTPDVVTFDGVSLEASTQDTHAVCVVSEGWVFSTEGHQQEAEKMGARCREIFLDVCTSLEPAYAAILNEDSLPCRYDLRSGRGARCFRNFFVSKKSFGAPTLDRLESLFSDSYVERLEQGLYISTWKYFNPVGFVLESGEAVRRSREVARLVA